MDCHFDEESSKGNLSLEGIKETWSMAPISIVGKRSSISLSSAKCRPRKNPTHHRRATVSFNGSGRIPKGWAQTGKQVASAQGGQLREAREAFRQENSTGLVAAPHLADSSGRLRIRHPALAKNGKHVKTLHPQVRWSRLPRLRQPVRSGRGGSFSTDGQHRHRRQAADRSPPHQRQDLQGKLDPHSTLRPDSPG